MKLSLPRHSTVVAYVAMVAALSGGGAYAAGQITSHDIKKNAVLSKHIKDGQVATVDLADNAVTGAKVNEASLGQVPSAATAGSATTATSATTAGNATNLGGKPASAYLSGSVYKVEAATDAGTRLGDNTNSKAMACDAGDVLLSGGPASVNKTSTLLESFPTPGSTNSWSARINDNGTADSFTVVVLCLDSAAPAH